MKLHSLDLSEMEYPAADLLRKEASLIAWIGIDFVIIHHVTLCSDGPEIPSEKKKLSVDFLTFIDLLLVLFTLLVTSTLSGTGLLAANTARAATTEGRGESEVNVLLGVEADHVRRNVDDLLADTRRNVSVYMKCPQYIMVCVPDVALLDQDTGVVDRLGETKLVDAGLQTALQEVLDLKGQDVIELHARLIEDTDTDETANQGVTLEETLGVLVVKSEQLTRYPPLVPFPYLKTNSQSRRYSNRARDQFSRHTEQHDGSWTRSAGRARPHACCADRTRRRSSIPSHYR